MIARSTPMNKLKLDKNLEKLQNGQFLCTNCERKGFKGNGNVSIKKSCSGGKNETAF